MGHDASVLGAAIAKRSSSSCENALDIDIAVVALGEVGEACDGRANALYRSAAVAPLDGTSFPSLDAAGSRHPRERNSRKQELFSG